MRSCCLPSEEVISVADSIDRLESTICALDVRCKAIYYQMTEALLKAKNYKKMGDTVRCKAELKQRFELMRTYERYVNLHTNVVKVRNSIDETKTIGEIAGNMQIANKVLEDALKTVDPEKIDELMNQLEEGTHKMHEISNILGEERGNDFDEEEAMRELNFEEIQFEQIHQIPLNLPDLPERDFSKIPHSI